MPEESQHRPKKNKRLYDYEGQTESDTDTHVTLRSFLDRVSGLSKSKPHAWGRIQKQPEPKKSTGVNSDVAQESFAPPLSPPTSDNPLMAREVIEASLQCERKLCLRLQGQRGAKSDYEMLCKDLRKKVAEEAVATLHSCNAESRFPSGVKLTASLLKRGHPFLINTRIQTEVGELHLKVSRKRPVSHGWVTSTIFRSFVMKAGKSARSKGSTLNFALCSLLAYKELCRATGRSITGLNAK